MTDELWNEIKARLVEDDNMKELIRVAFMEAVQKYVGLHITIDTSQRKCPNCRSDMTLRVNRTNGIYFWGCKRYPVCKGREDASELEVQEFKKRYPDKFQLLQEQQELYKEGKLGALPEEKNVENAYQDLQNMIEEATAGKKKRGKKPKQD